MTKLLLILYTYSLSYYWTFLEVLFIILWILLIKRYKISGQKTAIFGFILLFVTMILSILGIDDIAGKIAQYVWIIFAIAFVQEFAHLLKYENK